METAKLGIGEVMENRRFQLVPPLSSGSQPSSSEKTGSQPSERIATGNQPFSPTSTETLPSSTPAAGNQALSFTIGELISLNNCPEKSQPQSLTRY